MPTGGRIQLVGAAWAFGLNAALGDHSDAAGVRPQVEGSIRPTLAQCQG